MRTSVLPRLRGCKLHRALRRLPALACLAACFLAGCGSSPAARAAENTALPGQPLADLTPAQRARFDEGGALFNRIYTPRDGLGPFFNENQCSACHTDPAAGGTGEQFALRAAHFQEPDRCELFAESSGENLQTNAIPALRVLGALRRDAPAAATARDRFSVPFLFGLGLAEAIPEEALLERADPDDRDGDGVSGRPGRDGAGRFARFGRKAEHASIESFVASALLFEMGLTSSVRPHELPLGAGIEPGVVDSVSDPEIDDLTLERMSDFVRFLAPLAPRIPEDSATRADIEEGASLFRRIGCADCHTPGHVTGPNAIDALDRRRFDLYSDLLLHDMGPELAGACGIAAAPSELRTEPLVGLGRRRVFLHDGRAVAIEDAVLAHGGEATRARAAFQSLDEVRRARIIRFLGSL